MNTTAIGVVLYRIKLNGCLVGKWSVASDKNDPPGTSTGELGTEIATPTEGKTKKMEGTYQVAIYLNEENIFPDGTLEIKKLEKNSYQLNWVQDGVTKYTGYGVKRKRYLAANYWAVGGA